MPPFGLDWAFFLDADGTLLELARRPQDVEVHPGLRDLLPRLVERSGGAVALVSGRSITALDAIFTPSRTQGCFLRTRAWHRIALHCRTAPELQALAETEMRSVAARLGEGFEVQEGKCAQEVKPAGRHKGSAVADFMREAPFAGRRPVLIGDDRTDEFGVYAVNLAGGHSTKVGPGEICAQWRLDAPASVRAWLAAWADVHCAPGGRRA